MLTDEARLDPMLQDVKYAFRGTLKRPAFSALVVLTLALGIGANSAMFGIVNSVLIKPLPYNQPDELVYMYGAFKQSDRALVSPPDFLDYRARNSVFSALAARTIFGTSVITGGDEPERVRSSIATANFFATLGVAPYRGRAFCRKKSVGVAADVRVYGQANDAPDMMYCSDRQPNAGFGRVTMNLAARVRGNPASIAPQLRSAIRSIEPDVPLAAIQPMTEILSDSRSGERFRAQVFGGFAAVALLLAVVGLYGMLAYSVTQRMREIGVRIALGARPLAVVRLVVTQGMTLVTIGVFVGIGASVAVTRLLAAQLFEVTPTDPMVFAAVSATLMLAGLAACILPAHRATRADPIAALRQE
jgi:hypothetical protein